MAFKLVGRRLTVTGKDKAWVEKCAKAVGVTPVKFIHEVINFAIEVHKKVYKNEKRLPE
jgi:hypothetical protein